MELKTKLTSNKAGLSQSIKSKDEQTTSPFYDAIRFMSHQNHNLKFMIVIRQKLYIALDTVPFVYRFIRERKMS